MAGGGDTPTLADEERAKQEFHELEISFNGDVDLEKYFNTCTKNSGHFKFISIDNLDLLLLPIKFQCLRSLKLIKHLADMTVKVSVTCISPNRPGKFPCSNYAGQRKLMAGSGCVTDVVDEKDIRCLQCPFEDCTETLGEHQVYGYVTLTTAAHVVCDDVEARNTIVEFFDDLPDCKTNVMRARGVKVATVSVEGDFCELLCVVHDKLMLKTMGRNFSEGTYFVMKANKSYHFERKVAPVLLKKTTYFDYEKLGSRILRSPFRDVFGLSGEKESWPCPFKDCREVSGVHQVYGYICINVVVDVLGEKGLQSPERLNVEVDYDIPGYRSGTAAFRGVTFGSASMLGSSRELLCVVHDRALFELIKYLVRGDKKVYLRHRFMSYCEIVYDIFKHILQIQRLSFCVGYKIIMHGNIKYDSSECVDSLMSLLAYTIPRIEKAFYFHGCSDACIVDKRIPVNVRTTIDTARDHIDGIIKYLRLYLRNLIGDGKERLIRLELQNLLAKDPVGRSSLNNFFERIVREYPGETNELFVTSINNKVLSFLVEFQDGFSLSDTAGDFRLSSEINDADDDHTGDDDADDDTLLVHISHPHGQSKHITFGKQTQCHTGDGFYRPLYTAPTCPGSSGGPVWVIPASGDPGQVYGVPHSGCHGNWLNQGCSWTLYP